MRRLSAPEADAVVAPPPQVDQLEAVVTATAEQLTMVGADVQRGDFTLSGELLDTADRPETQHNTSHTDPDQYLIPILIGINLTV